MEVRIGGPRAGIIAVGGAHFDTRVNRAYLGSLMQDQPASLRGHRPRQAQAARAPRACNPFPPP
jgi:hypothetical protein